MPSPDALGRLADGVEHVLKSEARELEPFDTGRAHHVDLQVMPLDPGEHAEGADVLPQA